MYIESKFLLVENFKRFFSVLLAENQDQKNLIYAMRYRVYCLEFNYEEPNSEELEYDEYDQRSKHCLIIHRDSGLPAGSVRLVPTFDSQEKDPLPLEKHCLESLDMDFINQLMLDRNSICEISRLAVDSLFRRRPGENTTRFGGASLSSFTHDEQRTFPLIAVACFLATIALSDAIQRDYGFAMMEPFLPRLMQRYGIQFQRAGQDTNYHGIRAPYFIAKSTAMKNINPDLFELYSWIRESILPNRS